ncbi:hypothetical protein V6N13_038134 [Hibiscus sabdariffa]|uniref:50S ribosomal protein L22, chloroplastic n=1 Tax=Hibiscus sabdariffa TaxID=183260 RepID=A0ABR2S3E9_9ROSI
MNKFSLQVESNKKNKNRGNESSLFELIDYSPTESDIARKQILTKSARKALALGKRLGVEIIRNKEVVEELMNLELQHIDKA